MKRERRTKEGTFLTLKHFLHFLGKRTAGKGPTTWFVGQTVDTLLRRDFSDAGVTGSVNETGARLSLRPEWHHRSSDAGV